MCVCVCVPDKVTPSLSGQRLQTGQARKRLALSVKISSLHAATRNEITSSLPKQCCVTWQIRGESFGDVYCGEVDVYHGNCTSKRDKPLKVLLRLQMGVFWGVEKRKCSWKNSSNWGISVRQVPQRAFSGQNVFLIKSQSSLTLWCTASETLCFADQTPKSRVSVELTVFSAGTSCFCEPDEVSLNETQLCFLLSTLQPWQLIYLFIFLGYGRSFLVADMLLLFHFAGLSVIASLCRLPSWGRACCYVLLAFIKWHLGTLVLPAGLRGQIRC